MIKFYGSRQTHKNNNERAQLQDRLYKPQNIPRMEINNIQGC